MQLPSPFPHPSTRRGFSLLEVTIALSLSGVLFGALWQLTATAGQQREAAGLSGQALTVTAAAKDYLGAEKNALLALPQLATLGALARVRMTESDTGDTATSLQGAGYLPQSFVNLNSYGQSYMLFVRREDGGTLGVADAGDRLIGLLLTTGGTAISDQMGARIAANMGAAGGFLYAAHNPLPPLAATTARGTAGGWEIDLASSGWAGIDASAQAGHIAALANLLPAGAGNGGSGGAHKIDDLEDAVADYGPDLNLFLGIQAGEHVAPGGQNNTGIGINALRNLTTGDGNIALGLNSGLAVTTGGNNILLGTAADVANGALGNQLNIGNTIYGDLSSKQVAIGSATLVPDVAFDVVATSSVRLASGTTAQRPACTAALAGAQRWNTTNAALEFCNGGSWVSPVMTSGEGTPPTPPAGSGYFVLTETVWDGNLGGLSGANAKCLTELTTKTSWMYYNAALAAGQLTASKVQAFLATYGFAQMPAALTTYYFAKVGNPAVGSATFTSDVNGRAPNNLISWSGGNYFSGSVYYWSGYDPVSDSVFVGGNGYGSNIRCGDWTSSSSGAYGLVGYSGATNGGRWIHGYPATTACNELRPLICFVHP